MAPLSSELRRPLESAIVAAREAAEDAAGKALDALAVDRDRVPAALDDNQRRLRNALRARGRQLGSNNLTAGLPFLIEEVAYEQWHRMLFARFLAENDLLIHPKMQVPVTLAECAELASEEGEADEWQLAARYASAMLPGIFRLDDPSAQVRLTPEGRQELERILVSLPAPLFRADDALGWVYQFWQSKRKKEVNASERKIGGADLPPVTQLFTEDYMVRFLLENSLGAWWAARHPHSPLIKDFKYLRYCEDGTPAVGTFPGWPDRAALITMMDPCCGSGHFDVAAFEMLRRMRMEEEDLSVATAADATLRDNIFGLELDPRCTQIATFALALAAWKAGGYRPLPVPNIACSGIPVEGQLETWTKLAGKDESLRAALERLYQLFRNASDLGSLINPADVPEQDRMFTPDYAKVEPLLEQALRKERDADDPASAVFGAAAEGVVRAAKLLSDKYTLIATNVPYLQSGKQADVLKEFCELHHPLAKTDLANSFVERCRAFTMFGGAYALVTPQNWLSQDSYKELRKRMLQEQTWHCATWLGPRAFETLSGEVVKPVLLILDSLIPSREQTIVGLDASSLKTAIEKASMLKIGVLKIVNQKNQLENPDYRIILDQIDQTGLLEKYAFCVQGLATSDDPQFVLYFWELPTIDHGWVPLLSTTKEITDFGGREQILHWENGQGRYYRHALKLKEVGRLGGWKSGTKARGNRGVIVSQMSSLPVSLYLGEFYDHNASVIIPYDQAYLPAIWAFCKSPTFNVSVRAIDKSLKPSNNTLVKVPFDLAFWQSVADEAGPLPEPHSNDPTQWLFDKHAVDSSAPLQIAVARLLGYRWPQHKPDNLDAFGDLDGIVCLPSVAREASAGERLRAWLATAFGKDWSAALQDRLLKEVGSATLQDWLRDNFFAQHCALFQNRPFIWHIWDGRKDGFSALVNYHKLDHEKLGRLIYTYLGDWIKTQRAERDAGVAGADGRLVAALELQKTLEAIREGEPPYDIYVRWKPLHQQSIGWNPDLDDGVRLNIRPFVEASVLRSRFNINWRKDPGKNPDSNNTERLNDLHYTIVQKQSARHKAKR